MHSPVGVSLHSICMHMCSCVRACVCMHASMFICLFCLKIFIWFDCPNECLHVCCVYLLCMHAYECVECIYMCVVYASV